MATRPSAPPVGRAEVADRPHRHGQRDGSKPAATVADRIVADIAAAGWPEGIVLGSETELLHRYGTSRAVFREAVRLVELQNVARMRRGPGGGLIVTAPSVDVVIDAVSVYLFVVDADVDEVFEARIALESAAAEIAPDRLDEDRIDAIRALEHPDPEIVGRLGDALAAEQSATRSEFVGVGHDLHEVLAELSGNRVLQLLTQVLVRLSRRRATPPEDAIDTVPAAHINRVHTRLVEAIVAGDREVARHRAERHLQELENWVR